MSGVAIVRHLLATDDALVAQVPASRIMAGDVPIGTTPPLIIVKQISSVPRLTIPMDEPSRQHLDRVQVSVLVKATDASPQGGGYPTLRAILALVRDACPNTHGTVGGISCDSILPDIEGPDLGDDETGVMSASRDFLVRWND